MNLDQLNQLFQSIWEKPNQIPESLAQWQNDLAEFFNSLDPNEQDLDKLETVLNQWQNTLEANRSLLEAHQVTLAKQLSSGKPTFTQSENAKKFNE